MKFTLDECMSVINQILNYPSIEYLDISHFFDQAISELNSELHTGIRPISYMYSKSAFDPSKLTDVVYLDTKPMSIIPTYNPASSENPTVCYDKAKKKVMYLKGSDTEYTVAQDHLFGIYAYFDTDSEDKQIVREMYQTVVIGDYAYWTPYSFVPTRDLNLIDILPYDFITLFLIPYVCFKYAIRDGDTGRLYSEEFTNGFQQLQKGYDIPSTVVLSTQAGKPAYKEDVEQNLSNLNISVPTRAIYESMKTPRNIQASYGGMYDTGGWL